MFVKAEISKEMKRHIECRFKLGVEQDYSGETAPFCGHAYWGTRSHHLVGFHELYPGLDAIFALAKISTHQHEGQDWELPQPCADIQWYRITDQADPDDDVAHYWDCYEIDYNEAFLLHEQWEYARRDFLHNLPRYWEKNHKNWGHKALMQCVGDVFNARRTFKAVIR